MEYKVIRFFAFVILMALLCLSRLAQGFLSDEKRLIKHLLENYEKVGLVGRPVYNTSETVHVNFGAALIKLEEMNGHDQTGTFSMWYRYSWNDILLTWNPSDFGGVDHVRVPYRKIWTPDLVLYNTVGPEKPVMRDAMAVVSSDGGVMWIPPMTVTVTCVSDGVFPFDTQRCIMKYGSWTYDGFKLDVNFYDNLEAIDITDYIVSNEWDLMSYTGKKNVKYYPCCSEPYPDLTFSLTFRRVYTSATYTFILPTALLFLLILTIFWLHPGSVSKFIIGILVFLAFLFLMANLALFYRARNFLACLSFGLILTFTAMLTSVITSAVAKRGESGRALPQCLSMVCVRVFGMILCSDHPQQTKPGQSTDSKGDADTDKQMLRQEWVAFAQVLDRIAFMVHFVVMVIGAGMFS